jgi:uncharacterized protein
LVLLNNEGEFENILEGAGMLKTIVSLALCLIFTSPAFAGFDEGFAAYKKGDYSTAMKEWRPLAEQGDASAQDGLGFLYFFGKGVTKDQSEAAKWYAKAAEHGNADAQDKLAAMYSLGLGVTKNDEESIKWYTKAAEQGNAHAQAMLGERYYSGQGVAKDLVEAAKWFAKAAEQGDAVVQAKLGGMYTVGNGVTQNPNEAAKWMSKAAAQGNDGAQFSLGVFYEKGFGVEKDLTKAEEFFTLAAKQGNENAKKHLAALQEKRSQCAKNATTMLFGEALICADQTSLRRSVKLAGGVPTQEDDRHWFDNYDSSKLLEGTTELSIGYIDGKFAKATYRYNSRMDPHKIVDVRSMVISKYGIPKSSEGNPSVGKVSYTWDLKDGIRVQVNRNWPDATVFLAYYHVENSAAMDAEMERQRNAADAEKRSKESKAF